MGSLNEVQKETKQSFGSNSFTTKIEENTVIFDSAKDSFTFADDTTFEGSVSIQGDVDLDVIDANEINVASVNAGEYLTGSNNDKVDVLYSGEEAIVEVPSTFSGTMSITSSLEVEAGQTIQLVNTTGVVAEGVIASGQGGNYTCRLYSGASLQGQVNFTAKKATQLNGEVTLAGSTMKYVYHNSIDSKYVPQLGGVEFRINSGDLQAKVGGEWKTITLED